MQKRRCLLNVWQQKYNRQQNKKKGIGKSVGGNFIICITIHHALGESCQRGFSGNFKLKKLGIFEEVKIN